VRGPRGVVTGAEVSSGLSVECDVVVVGSGAGGATMAVELAEAGVDVVVVEEGGYYPTESFSADSVRALRTLYRDGGGGMAVGRPSVLFAEGRCVGGSTVVNGGMSWRTPGEVLARWSEEVQSISEREMEPYFARAEARHSVGLQDPETVGRDSELMRAGAAAKGWAVVPNRRGQLHCAGTNNCNSGCPTGAKRSMLVTSVPRALALGARLYADCRVDRITRAGRTVTGLTGHFVRPGGRPGRSRRPRCWPGRGWAGRGWAGRGWARRGWAGRGWAADRSGATCPCTPTPPWWRSSTRTLPAGTACTRPSRSASSWPRGSC